MNHIDDFFGKLKNIFAAQVRQKEAIVSVCLRHGVSLAASQVEIKNRIVRLNISPVARSLVFLKKTEILEDINRELKPPILDIH